MPTTIARSVSVLGFHILALLGATSLPAQDPALPRSGLEERLRGCWSAAESGQLLWFDGPRCVVASGLQQTVMEVRYLSDTSAIERSLLGQVDRVIRSTIEFESDHHVRLGGKDRSLTLMRVAGPGDELPEAVRTEPMVLGDRALSGQEVADVAADLMARREREQAVREALSAAEQRVRARCVEEGRDGNPFEDPEVQAVMSRMQQIDRANTRYLKDLLAEIGWIDAARFGDGANQSAFLIAQHCGNLAMLQAVLRAMKRDFNQGHAASGPRFALLYDRLSLAQGDEQRYGSQLHGRPDGSLHFPRLEDPGAVDARRKAVGLEPLVDYANRFGETPIEMPEGYVPGGG